MLTCDSLRRALSAGADPGDRATTRSAPRTLSAIWAGSMKRLRQYKGNQTIEVPPAASATPVNQPGLTNAGLPRQRLKWTEVMNKDILRIYYRVTDCERDRGGYGQKLFDEFILTYPELPVTIQRVSDQYRTIIRKNLVPQTERDLIRRQVGAEMERNSLAGSVEEVMQENTTNEEYPAPISEESIPGPIRDVQNLREGLGIEMRMALTMFEGTNPVCRPKIPKINAFYKVAEIIEIMNKEIIPPYLATIYNLEQIHLILYCAAVTVVKTLGLRFGQESEMRQNWKSVVPAWERRLIQSVENLRKDIAKVEALVKGANTAKLRRKVETIIKRYRKHSQRDHPNITPIQCLDTLKQRLSVLSTRLRRYRKSRSRKLHNSMFYKSEKMFYRKLRAEKNTEYTNFPSKTQISTFWEEQLSTSIDIVLPQSG
ncbi:hypothetical protein EVAR_91098_1 [Eumeta japonica]|uniref:Uncharacterized protein n=1 Tax=Eumeta variegata TaxID=151549 RepID=A0A4C2A7B8_EUMVA|nr:hypothetical protein EVAR_91098_1 [Eumeta japonica]